MTAELVLNRCAYCGLSVWRGRGGWRHTVSGMRICQPVVTARLATPRAATSKTPVLPYPRVAGSGRVPAEAPPGGTQYGPGRLPAQGQGSRPGPAHPVADETWAWQTAKECFPELAAVVVAWLELGDRVYAAMRDAS